MNFKVLKLNLKISWLKFTGKLDTISNSDNFSPATIDSPCILIILPIDRELIPKAMKCISRIMDVYNKKNAKFTVIVNNNIQDKVKLIVPLPYLKTSENMPMLRPPDLVAIDEVGEIISIKAPNIVEIKFRRGSFLIDTDKIEKI